jgi:hypothetical protein
MKHWPRAAILNGIYPQITPITQIEEQTADGRQQTADGRQQTAGRRRSRQHVLSGTSLGWEGGQPPLLSFGGRLTDELLFAVCCLLFESA